MPPPPIIDLDTSSDVRFRDIVGRDQYQVALGGNLTRRVFQHVSGNVANVSAVEVVSADAGNNAQFDLLLSTPTAPLVLANITPANIATWSGNNSILSLRQGTTTLRSANVAVGNLNVAGTLSGNLVNFAVPSGSLVKLDNCLIRCFQKTLGATAGNWVGICTLSNSNGAYAVDLHVVQSESGASVSKAYKFVVYADATQGTYHRLIPLSGSVATEWGVEIRVITTTLTVTITTTNLRLVRLSGSTTTHLECTLTLYQSSFDDVSINTNNTVSSGVTFSPTVYDSCLVTQTRGNVGIGTDNPTSLLTVAGQANVVSLFAQNNILVGTGVGATGEIADSTVLQQGAYMGWNSVNGCTTFVCKRGLGPGGFHFYRSDGGGNNPDLYGANRFLLANFDSGGIKMNQGGFAAPGSIVNSLFAAGSDTTIRESITISPNTFSRATNANGWATFATSTYTPKRNASRLSIFFDIAYDLSGSNGDNYKSRITVDNVEVCVKQQNFNAGGTGTYGRGTRSNVIFPISGVVANTTLSARTVRFQVNLAGTDDVLTLIPNQWVLRILERTT